MSADRPVTRNVNGDIVMDVLRWDGVALEESSTTDLGGPLPNSPGTWGGAQSAPTSITDQ